MSLRSDEWMRLERIRAKKGYRMTRTSRFYFFHKILFAVSSVLHTGSKNISFGMLLHFLLLFGYAHINIAYKRLFVVSAFIYIIFTKKSIIGMFLGICGDELWVKLLINKERRPL